MRSGILLECLYNAACARSQNLLHYVLRAQGMHLSVGCSCCLSPWLLCSHGPYSHVALVTPHCTGRASIPILKPVLPTEGS